MLLLRKLNIPRSTSKSKSFRHILLTFILWMQQCSDSTFESSISVNSIVPRRSEKKPLQLRLLQIPEPGEKALPRVFAWGERGRGEKKHPVMKTFVHFFIGVLSRSESALQGFCRIGYGCNNIQASKYIIFLKLTSWLSLAVQSTLRRIVRQ